MEKFLGPLDPQKLTGLEKQGLRNYYRQRSRCNNKRDKRYNCYGAKGIKVEYSAREFVYWFVKECKKTKVKRISVGRIDHSKNYTFSNIMVQDFTENSMECKDRRNDAYRKWWENGAIGFNRSVATKFVNLETKEEKSFKTMKDAANFFGVYNEAIRRWLNAGKVLSKKYAHWTIQKQT